MNDEDWISLPPYHESILCRKRGYTKKEAQSVVNSRTKGRRQRRNGRPEYLRIYECPNCNQWHVTHEEPR